MPYRGPMVEVDEDRFVELVADALDGMPEGLLRLVDNVAVLVADEHPTEDLLGLYSGLPLTERDDYGYLDVPDTVTIYRLAICDMCADHDEVVEQVRITVVHEIAHHFGLDDDALTDLGWG